MIRRAALIALTLFVVLAVSAPAAGALNRPPNGKYNCYVTYTYPVFTGRYVKVTGPGTYSWYNGKRLGRGTYRYAAGRDVVIFKTGPLSGKTAKHVRYGNGTHGLTIAFRTPSGPSNYACSRV